MIFDVTRIFCVRWTIKDGGKFSKTVNSILQIKEARNSQNRVLDSMDGRRERLRCVGGIL